MSKKVLIVLISLNDKVSAFKLLRDIEKSNFDNNRVLLVNNDARSDDVLERNRNNFSCVHEYIKTKNPMNLGVILNKIKPLVTRYEDSDVFFITDDYLKTYNYLPVLSSLSNVSKNTVLGVCGGSIFSAFFFNYKFFQSRIRTEWVDFNGMYIRHNIWKKCNELIDTSYFSEFFSIDFCHKISKNGYDFFKLKSFEFKEVTGLRLYFRARNPFLFLHKNSLKFRHLYAILYLLVQFPYAVLKSHKDVSVLNGLKDGIKIVFSKSPRNTS